MPMAATVITEAVTNDFGKSSCRVYALESSVTSQNLCSLIALTDEFQVRMKANPLSLECIMEVERAKCLPILIPISPCALLKVLCNQPDRLRTNQQS